MMKVWFPGEALGIDPLGKACSASLCSHWQLIWSALKADAMSMQLILYPQDHPVQLPVLYRHPNNPTLSRCSLTPSGFASSLEQQLLLLLLLPAVSQPVWAVCWKQKGWARRIWRLVERFCEAAGEPWSCHRFEPTPRGFAWLEQTCKPPRWCKEIPDCIGQRKEFLADQILWMFILANGERMVLF